MSAASRSSAVIDRRYRKKIFHEVVADVPGGDVRLAHPHAAVSFRFFVFLVAKQMGRLKPALLSIPAQNFPPM
jgi:hypothetical protein